MEDRKTKEILRILHTMHKRPGLYFGTEDKRSYFALRMFLAGYECGTRKVGEEELHWSIMDQEVWRELQSRTDGKVFSDQELFDIFFEALELVLKRDYPQYIKETGLL